MDETAIISNDSSLIFFFMCVLYDYLTKKMLRIKNNISTFASKTITVETMKIHYILLSCIMLCFSAAIYAQKQTVFVDDFNSDIKVPTNVLAQIRASVINGIIKTNRVSIVDALTIPPTEETYAPIENALRYRAQYLLQGRLLNREATDDGISPQKQFHSRENSYKEEFILSIQLVRTSDGTTIFSRNYEENGSSSGREASQYNALKNALINIPYKMRTFIEQYFKVHGTIVELVTDNGRKAKSVYINLGYNDPITEGQRFDVIAETTINGYLMGKKIGEIRIKEMTGPKFSLCKVMSKGGEDILKALQKKTKLHIISRQARLFDD